MLMVLTDDGLLEKQGEIYVVNPLVYRMLVSQLKVIKLYLLVMCKKIGILISLVMLVAFCSWAEAADTTSQVLQLPDTLQVTVQQAAPAVADTIESGDSRLKKTIESIPAVELKEIFSFAKLFWAGIFFLVAYFVIRFLSRSIEAWSEKNAERRIKGKAILPIVKIVSWLIVSYIIIRGIFNPPVQSLIALGLLLGWLLVLLPKTC